MNFMAAAVRGFTTEALREAAEGNQRSAVEQERELVSGLRAGREQAYEALIAEYQHPVYGLVYRLLGDAAESADVTQEVFLKIFRNIATFREHSSLRTWIYRIAVNEAYNSKRWFSRHHRQEISTDPAEPGRPGIAWQANGPSPFELAAGQEMRAKVERALTLLNPNFRAAVVLRDIEDLSYDEIAAILDVSLGTVKSRILRGREALRRLLTAEFENEVQPAWVHRGLGLAKTVD
jgi:RNA polymerase sigma-70 factor (ECF subfamily)